MCIRDRDRIARFIVAHNKRVVAATVLLSLLAAAMLFRMSFNADVTSFIIEGNATGREYFALQQKYDTGDPINALISVPEGESFAQGAVLARLLLLLSLIH